MPRGVPRCRHWWKKIGSAPRFRGQACRLWRCIHCGDEREVFADVDLNDPYKRTPERNAVSLSPLMQAIGAAHSRALKKKREA